MGVFINKYPEVTISLEISDTEKIIADISAGLVEIAITGAKSNDKNIIQEAIIEDQMALIVNADHKWNKQKSVSLEMITNEPFIMREEGSGTLKSLQLSFEKVGFDYSQLNVVATMGNTAAICQGIKSNVGISIMSPKLLLTI